MISKYRILIVFFTMWHDCYLTRWTPGFVCSGNKPWIEWIQNSGATSSTSAIFEHWKILQVIHFPHANTEITFSLVSKFLPLASAPDIEHTVYSAPSPSVHCATASGDWIKVVSSDETWPDCCQPNIYLFTTCCLPWFTLAVSQLWSLPHLGNIFLPSSPDESFSFFNTRHMSSDPTQKTLLARRFPTVMLFYWLLLFSSQHLASVRLLSSPFAVIREEWQSSSSNSSRGLYLMLQVCRVQHISMLVQGYKQWNYFSIVSFVRTFKFEVLNLAVVFKFFLFHRVGESTVSISLVTHFSIYSLAPCRG